MSEGEQKACVGCRTPSPATTTNYTLISADHGWRLSRRVAADGTKVAEWRCPDCWRKHKQATSAGVAAAKRTPNSSK